MKTGLKHFRLILLRYEKHVLIFLFFLTMLLRTLHVVYENNKFGTSKWVDDLEYLEMGEQIAAGNWDPSISGLPHMQVAPGLPLLIAFSKLTFRNIVIPIYIYNILISSFVIIAIFYLGKNLFGRKVAWVGVGWAILNIEFFKYNPHLLKEATVFFLLPLLFLMFLKNIKINLRLSLIVISALVFSLLIHFDERYFIYFPILIMGFFIDYQRNKERIPKAIFVWLSVVCLTMVPWGIRNYNTFKQVVIISPRTTSFTQLLWGKKLTHISFESDERNSDQNDQYKVVDFSEKFGIVPYRYKKSEARFKSLVHFWQPVYFNPTFIADGFRPQKWSLLHNLSSLMFYGIFLPFYFIGFIFLLREKNYCGLYLTIIPLIHSLLHAYMIWPLERYRSPINFIIVLVGIYSVFQIKDLRETRLKNRLNYINKDSLFVNFSKMI